MEERFDASGGQKTSDGGAGVDRSIVPVQKPLSCRHFRPLPVETLHEFSEDLYDVVRVDFVSDRGEMLIYGPGVIEEGENDLLLP